jgi:DNA-binding IclR family transcriptional regulator
MGVTQLAERLGTAKSTVHRMLTTLEAQNWVRQSDVTDLYELTWKPFEIGARLVRSKGLGEQIAYVLRQVADESGESAKLGVWERQEIVVIYKVDAGESFRMDLHVGTRLPAYCTAVGKALLAALDERELEAYLVGRDLKPFTRNSIVDPVSLREDLAATRQRGYAVDCGEHHDDVNCVAAPVRDCMGRPVASLSISGPASRLPPEEIARLGQLVLEAARKLSAMYGYSPHAA